MLRQLSAHFYSSFCWNLSKFILSTYIEFCALSSLCILMPPLPLERCQRLSPFGWTVCTSVCASLCVCLWTCTKSLSTRYLINCLWEELNQIYIFGAVAHKNELIRFWVKEVKGQGHSETTYGTLACIFSPISRMHECIWMTRSTQHTGDIFKVMGLKVKVTDNIF